MIFYCDYEALEFNNNESIKEGIYPYYLDNNLSETSLCPLFFSASNNKGKLVYSQNVYKKRISFLDFLDTQINKFKDVEHKVLKVNFHNVKYDFRIIIYELFYNNFIHVFDSENITYKGEVLAPRNKSFSIVGENLSKYIGINIYYKEFKILIRDTMSIINSSQDSILKTFGYDTKINVDWNAININNLKSWISTIEERCNYDVTSLAKAIEEFKTTFENNFHGKSATASSMSLDAFKYFLCELNNVEEINHEVKNEVFRSIYPIQSELERILSIGAYHGGICTINQKHANKLLYNLQMADINSSYPFSMTLPLPYGKGTIIDNFTDNGYSEYVIYVEFKSKGIPFVRCHSENRARALLGLEFAEKVYTRSQFPTEFKGYICINSIDLEQLKKYYKINCLEFKKGINYKTNTLLAKFIIPLYESRKKAKGLLKTAIKLLLNSLYGKFAQDLSGVVFNYKDIKDYNKIIAIDNDTLYKPLASCVTAYSRKNLIDTMYLLKDDFVYCDTDSLYFLNPEKNLKMLEENGLIHDNELGKWATEYDTIEKGKFLSKKNYLITTLKDNKRIDKLTCVGLSHRYHNQVNYDNFKLNSEPFTIQKMVNIYGGKAMRWTTFIIKERSI